MLNLTSRPVGRGITEQMEPSAFTIMVDNTITVTQDYFDQ